MGLPGKMMPLSKFERDSVKSVIQLELNTAFVHVARFYEHHDGEKMIYAKEIEKAVRKAVADAGKMESLEYAES
jgi:hypothetical protein